MADREDIQKRVREEEDYIRCPKASNSLTKFLSKNSDGVEDATIARLLAIPEEQVAVYYAEAVALLREGMTEDE